MNSTTIAVIAGLTIGLWIAQANAIGSEPSAADQADYKPASAATETTAAAETKEFKPPRGFTKKQRGKYVLYCKRTTALGTRLSKETCYDEAQMRDYVIAQEENKRDVDRVRATCVNVCACGRPEAC